ncbi:MAG: serine/threonine-protein kinase [Thermoanaerobaculia bacterium]
MTEKGRRLGRYRLDELLGQGGMAEVWRATDERLNRTVAVKVILANHARDAHFRQRFQKEAQLVASLDHPNILPVYDYGDEEGLPYLVMPFLEGGTLRDRMVGSPVPFAQAVSWIRQLGDALDAAHAAGILHRDVKPANVLIRKDDRLALADFGIAKMLEGSTGLTATGMVVGTPIYMAPEQAQGRPATPASDRYALAVLAYELLSGKPPFDGESALSLMHQHVTSPAPRLSSAVYGLPAGLDPVFERALSKEPERRPATCRAFADELLAFVPTGAGLEVERATTPWARIDATAPTVYEATPKRLSGRAATRGSALTSEPTISTSPQPARRTLFAAAGSVVAVAVLAGAWFLVPRRVPSTATPAAAPAPAPAPAPSPVPTEAPAGDVKVVDLPLPTAPVPAATTAPPQPSPATGVPRAAATRPAAPAPPGASEPSAPPPPDEPASDAALRAARGRLDPVARGGTRPTRGDFEAAGKVARAVLEREPDKAGAEALELYARGGIAYLEHRDDEAVRQVLAAQAAAGKTGTWDYRFSRGLAERLRGGSGPEGWELALAYGDARHEAEALIARDLARDATDPRALLGRAALRRMERKSGEAIADATAVWQSHPPAALAAAAAELLADEHATLGAWEAAARWYRSAAIPQSPFTSRAGWEGGRILQEKLGRADEAHELWGVACRAGNRKACLAAGEPETRPRPFARRRGP